MNKEEILELNKKDNQNGDELQRKVRSRGRIIAMNVMYILAIIILLLNQYFGKQYAIGSVLNDILLIWFSVDLVRHMYTYIKEQDKYALLNGFIDLVLVIWCLYDFIKDIL